MNSSQLTAFARDLTVLVKEERKSANGENKENQSPGLFREKKSETALTKISQAVAERLKELFPPPIEGRSSQSAAVSGPESAARKAIGDLTKALDGASVKPEGKRPAFFAEHASTPPAAKDSVNTRTLKITQIEVPKAKESIRWGGVTNKLLQRFFGSDRSSQPSSGKPDIRALGAEQKTPTGRYTNIYSEKASQVKWTAEIGSEKSFPANHMPGDYIASHAPTDAEMESHAEMIRATGLKTIVMATDFVEKGSKKADQYWLTHEQAEASGNPRNLPVQVGPTIKGANGSFVRDLDYGHGQIVKHYQMTNWPDHDVPSTTQEKNLFKDLVKIHRESRGKVLAHCSAGVGRTGVIALVSHVLDKMAEMPGPITEKLLYSLVEGAMTQMRGARTDMVQRDVQLRFALDMIKEIGEGDSAISDKISTPQQAPTSTAVASPASKEAATLINSQLRHIFDLDPDQSATSTTIRAKIEERASDPDYKTYLNNVKAGLTQLKVYAEGLPSTERYTVTTGPMTGASIPQTARIAAFIDIIDRRIRTIPI